MEILAEILHFKSSRFYDRTYLKDTALYLEISNYLNLSYNSSLYMLRVAKAKYLSLKQTYNKLHDDYTSNLMDHIELKVKQRKEYEKMKRAKLK